MKGLSKQRQTTSLPDTKSNKPCKSIKYEIEIKIGDKFKKAWCHKYFTTK